MTHQIEMLSEMFTPETDEDTAGCKKCGNKLFRLTFARTFFDITCDHCGLGVRHVHTEE